MDKTEKLYRRKGMDKGDLNISHLAAEEQDLPPGYVLGKRYKIIRCIGRGGMSRVYKVYDLSLDTQVSLKIMRSDYFRDPRFVKKFKNELFLSRKINHPNILQIYDLEHVGDYLFITMQYIEGQNLKEFLRENRNLDLGSLCRIAIQIIQGLKAAHSARILHNDLKPHNIILDRHQKVYIADFGLSTLIRQDDSVDPGSQGFAGTPNYIAPEIWRDKKYSYQADLYSFGILFFEMIYGTPPFDSRTVYDIISRHLQSSPRFPVTPRIPSYIRDIIILCLHKDPDRRTITKNQIIRSLERGRRCFPLGRFSHSRKILWAGLAAISLLAGIVFFVPRPPASGGSPNPRKTVILHPLENRQPNPTDSRWGSFLTSLLDIDLSQSLHLKVIQGPRPTDNMQKSGRGEAFIIRGDYVRERDVFQVNIRLIHNRNQDLLYTVSESGLGRESVYHIIDTLSAKIKKHLELSPRALQTDIDQDIATITSRNPQALVFYLSALQHYRENRYQLCIDDLIQALTLDPSFASAHLLVAEAYQMERNTVKMRFHLGKALDLSGQTSLKERLFIRACYHHKVDRDINRSIDVFNRLLDLYPDDPKIQNYLGGLYRLNEEWHRALLIFRKSGNPVSFSRINNIFYIHLTREKFQEARSHLARFRDHVPNPSLYHRYRAYTYLQGQEFETALAEVEKSLDENSSDMASLLLKGQIYYLMNRMAAAQKIFRYIISHDMLPYYTAESRFMLASLALSSASPQRYPALLTECDRYLTDHRQNRGKTSIQIYRARFHLETGQVKTAGTLLDSALENTHRENDIYHQLSIYLYMGLAALADNKIDKALQAASRLEEIIRNKQGIKKLRYFYLLSGYISRYRGMDTLAVNQFRMAESLLSKGYGFRDTALFYRALGDTYYDNRNYTEALKYYQQITRLTFGRIHLGDVYRKALQRMTAVYEIRGHSGKAEECRQILAALAAI